MENKHIYTSRIINVNLKNKFDSIDSNSIKESDIDEYDIIFKADEIIENNNILCISGFIGYSFDETSVKFIYDINENKIYIASNYRLMNFKQEYDLFTNTYQISYDKEWKYEKINDDYLIQEKEINVKYKKIDDTSIPYYRFPRTKDGISIVRVIYNIFTIFQDENTIKPVIIIPNSLNIYNSITQ